MSFTSQDLCLYFLSSTLFAVVVRTILVVFEHMLVAVFTRGHILAYCACIYLNIFVYGSSMITYFVVMPGNANNSL